MDFQVKNNTVARVYNYGNTVAMVYNYGNTVARVYNYGKLCISQDYLPPPLILIENELNKFVRQNCVCKNSDMSETTFSGLWEGVDFQVNTKT